MCVCRLRVSYLPLCQCYPLWAMPAGKTGYRAPSSMSKVQWTKSGTARERESERVSDRVRHPTTGAMCVYAQIRPVSIQCARTTENFRRLPTVQSCCVCVCAYSMYCIPGLMMIIGTYPNQLELVQHASAIAAALHCVRSFRIIRYD